MVTPPDLSPEDVARALAVAEDAHRLSTTLLTLHPTDSTMVEVVYGPAPFEDDLPAGAQPRAFILYWLGIPGSPPPKPDEFIAVQGIIDDVHMVMWVIFEPKDVESVIRNQWGLEVKIPTQLQTRS